MMYGQLIKRIAIIAAVVIVLIVVIVQIYTRATTTKVTVTVNRKDGYIKILDKNGLETPDIQEYSGQKLKKVTQRLKPGQYTVVAYTKTSYTNKIINVKDNENLSLSLTLDPTTNTEPVIGDGSLSTLFAGDNDLYFIDSQTGNLKHIDDAGDVEIENITQVFKKARWNSSGLGVIEDANNRLYMISNGNLSQLALPFPVSGNAAFAFDIGPDGKVYVSNGQDIFAGGPGGFTKIYSSGGNFNQALAATSGAVAFMEKNSDDGSSSLVVLKGDKKKRVDSDASQIAWSPSGTYIAASDGTKTGTAYDSSLSRSYPLPNLAPDNLVWASDKSLLYYSSNSIWAYSVQGQESKVIANLSAGRKVSAQTMSGDLSSMYFSSKTGERQQIIRIGVKGQPANNSLATLDAFLPEDVGVCSLDYVNFTKPVINIEYPKLETTAELCVKAAKGELKYYDLDPNRFTFNTGLKKEIDAD